MIRTSRLTAAVVLALSLGLSSCALVHHYDAISGQVVDLDTGEPLEGAAVHASYYTIFYNMIDPTSWYLNSQETKTDANGKFTIPSQYAFAFRPMNLFDDYVDIIVFKPGYGCYGNLMMPSPKLLKGHLTSKQTSLLGLPRLHSYEERRASLSCKPSTSVPQKDFSYLFSLINQERIILGLQPVP